MHELRNKLVCKFMRPVKDKLYAVTCTNVKDFRNIQVVLEIDQSVVQLFVADYQISQVLQLDMFVCKRYYF